MHRVVWKALAAAIVVACSNVGAQQYPRKPITMIVGFPPGAATDTFARVAGKRMSEVLGQQVIVINRDGAAGVIATDQVARAAPDGYTVLWGSASALAILPASGKKLPFDPQRDLEPVSLAAKISYMLVTHPSVPATNLKQLIALAKARPGQLNFSSAGTGGSSHLAGELFKSMAKIDIVHVPFRGTALFATALIAGEVDLAFAGVNTVLPHTNSGRLKALANTGPKRSEIYPNVPTMIEAGLPGYEFTQWYALLAPSKTPPEIVAVLNDALRKSLEDAEVKKRIASEGGTTTPTSPQGLASFIKSETASFEKIIKTAGIKLE
ncbi:MAG: Bug family tripartite tricarboxylate transporter substrate binding protein [Burkholderiales bacterium]